MFEQLKVGDTVLLTVFGTSIHRTLKDGLALPEKITKITPTRVYVNDYSFNKKTGNFVGGSMWATSPDLQLYSSENDKSPVYLRRVEYKKMKQDLDLLRDNLASLNAVETQKIKTLFQELKHLPFYVSKEKNKND